jgi:hypothetical protein
MEVIYGYSAEQGIEDGFLDKVPEQLAREAGFKCPVMLASGAQAEVAVPAGMEGEQDYTGRLWDVLCLVRGAFLAGDPNDRMRTGIKVIFRNAPGRDDLVTLWAVIDGAGVTIMVPSDY